jgi:hypothetical protein
MAKLSNKYFFSNYFGDLKFKKKLCNSMFLVYVYISAWCKSLPLEQKHDDGTGLVKMQEDPRSSTCCCPAKYFLLGANLHSLNIESKCFGRT